MLYLGTITPTKEQWLSVNAPVELTAIALTYQTYTNESFDLVYSWIRLRRVWNYDNQKLHEPSRRLYPSSDQLILPLGAPPSSLLLNSTASDIEVKKYYRLLPFQYTEPDWFITFYGIG